jgi:hypothetical protein
LNVDQEFLQVFKHYENKSQQFYFASHECAVENFTGIKLLAEELVAETKSQVLP